jgi:hypothetical protein
MEKKYIQYKGDFYPINPPTIEMWSKITVLQEWMDEMELYVVLLSEVTGLSKEEIENADYQEVFNAAQIIADYFLSEGTEFINKFEFNGKHYKFIDLPNLTFGEFIDIDTFLQKPVNERKKEMNMLMAMLYREVDENGNYKPYDSKQLEVKAQEFKKLSIKYINGASSFFLRLEKILQGDTKVSFWSKRKTILKLSWMLLKFVVLTIFGGGLVLLYHWPMKTLRKLTKSRRIR